MAYFLRGTKRKNEDTYFQVYESYYDRDLKKSRARSAKKLGLLSLLKKEGESDEECIRRLKETVSEMEDARKKESEEEIDDEEKALCYGTYLMNALIDKLDIRKMIDLLAIDKKIRFSLSDVLFPLAEARVVDPCSKHRTFSEVFPMMYDSPTDRVSLDQMYEGLSILGEYPQDVVDILNAGVESICQRKLETLYFDCTNYYFEIDAEDGFRMKGPSKEGRHDPIVGMALLLDSECIPYQMELYPGNRNEKPYLPSAVKKAREKKGKKAKLIQVADKGLNCAENIELCGENDGYIFSRSLKNTSLDEIDWIFKEDGWTEVKDEKGALIFKYKSITKVFDYSYRDENGKTVTFQRDEKRLVSYNPSLKKKQCREVIRQYNKAAGKTGTAKVREDAAGKSAKYLKANVADKETGEILEKGKIVLEANEEKLQHDLKIAGYNMIVTSELEMDDRKIYDTYHELWNIERTFRMMKTQLSSRPVYGSTKEFITGHFLSCYTAILIIRLLERKVFDKEFTSEEIIDYIKKARAVSIGNGEYLNVMKREDAKISEKIREVSELPLLKKRLTKSDIASFFEPKKVLKPTK